MANTDAFAIQRSDLNGFLFADVGVEANGMTLSVLSTFARLGMDPWDEAGRLARQPKSTAIEALARMIAAMPSSLWPLPDSTAIAARLVPLLPTRGHGGGQAAAVRIPAAQATAIGKQMTIGKQILGRLPVRGMAKGADRTGPSVLVLVLLAGLLAGLSAYLVVQRNATADGSAPIAEIRPASPDTPSRAPPSRAPDTVPGAVNKGA